MSKELAYVLINPYSIRKSRTGGIIARYLSRTDLRLVAARMFGPTRELAEDYARMIYDREPAGSPFAELLRDYVLREYAPDPETGLPHRTMCLLFEGRNAVEKIWRLTGSVSLRWGCGETIRETYGDYILDENKQVTYFEPAVLVGPTVDFTNESLQLWADWSDRCGGVISNAADLPDGQGSERTLVMLKPDNFQGRSLRLGNIMDLLSSAGLRIVAIRAVKILRAEGLIRNHRDTAFSIITVMPA